MMTDILQADAKRRPVIGLLGASFGTGNHGVAALACGTAASVFHAYPNARFFLLDYGKEPAIHKVRHPGGTSTVELVNIRFSKKLLLRNNIAGLLFLAFLLRFLPSHGLRNRIIERNAVLKVIQDADIIGSIAGGDSFSDIYGLRRLLYVALPQILVLWMNKPLVLLPQTFGPFDSALSKRIAGYIFSHARKIYSRDRAGLETVRLQTGGNDDNGRVEFAYDMGFALEPHILPERIPPWLAQYDRKTPLVGVNINGLLYIGGYTRGNMFGLKTEYSRVIHDIVASLVRKHGVHVMLVPHVFGAGNKESDADACRSVYEKADKDTKEYIYLLNEYYDQHETKALIGHCDFFIGSRMHACIAALSQCVPAIGLAYSEKFKGVFESFGLSDLIIDMRTVNGDTANAGINRAFLRRLEIRADLNKKMLTVRPSVLGLFGRILV